MGKRKVPMKDLVAALQNAGCRSVRTYLQSGNIVFQSGKGTARSLGSQIAKIILDRFGFEPSVMVLNQEELTDAVRNNPFPQANEDPKSLHLCFLAGAPANPDLEALTRLKAGKEAFALKGKVFYLHTPDGYGNSKLAARVEHCLGVDATCRNWRTANQLLEMASETPGAS
jgi:uncharacterized protein (DUF1697 family)